MSYQNYGLGLGGSRSEQSADLIDQAEQDLIRQINELANEDCNSSELNRMREMILGDHPKEGSSNSLKNLSQENHLSFANRQYPGIAARLRELRQSRSDIDLHNLSGSRSDFMLNKQSMSQQLALSNYSDNSDEQRKMYANMDGGQKKSGSDFGQIIEEEKEEQKNNDEFNRRSHVHKRF